MNDLDLILLVLAALVAARGYQRGLLRSVLATVGFLGGATLGAHYTGVHQSKAVVALVAGTVGEFALGHAAGAIRHRVTGRPVLVVDGLGGAACSTGAFLVLAGILATAAAAVPSPGLRAQIRHSEGAHLAPPGRYVVPLPVGCRAAAGLRLPTAGAREGWRGRVDLVQAGAAAERELVPEPRVSERNLSERFATKALMSVRRSDDIGRRPSAGGCGS